MLVEGHHILSGQGLLDGIDTVSTSPGREENGKTRYSAFSFCNMYIDIFRARRSGGWGATIQHRHIIHHEVATLQHTHLPDLFDLPTSPPKDVASLCLATEGEKALAMVVTASPCVDLCAVWTRSVKKKRPT